MNRTTLIALALAVSTAPTTAQIGSVLSAQKINELFGGFTGVLDDEDYFGAEVELLGDLNGDGVEDVAVGAPRDDDGGVNRGAIWVLFLNPDKTVAAHQKISQTQGGFAGTLADFGGFGRQIVNVGDLDGNGATDLVVESGAPNRMWTLFLDSAGQVVSHVENLFTDPVFVPATLPRAFSSNGMAAMGDLDGDGVPELAVGAPFDDDSGAEAGAVWVVRLNADGTLKAAQKINSFHGGFGGTLEAGDRFGDTVEVLRDIDSDGSPELLVRSLRLGIDPATAWVLFLDANGDVASETEYGRDAYGLTGPNASARVAEDYAWLGDLDGDGVGEIAMGFRLATVQDAPNNVGAVGVGFLTAGGNVRKRTRISHELGGMPILTSLSGFGWAVSPLGDLDNDGTMELAIGAPWERASGSAEGAIWIVSLDPSEQRNGSGINPSTLSQNGPPVFSSPYALTLDCSAHAPGAAFVIGTDQPFSGLVLPVGEVLITGNLLFQSMAAHASGPVVLQSLVPPPLPELIDLPVFAQGLCFGAPGPQLGNAVDAVLGF